MDCLKNNAFFILITLCSLCFSAIHRVFYLLLSVFYLEKYSSFLIYFYLCPQATKPITYVTSNILMNL